MEESLGVKGFREAIEEVPHMAGDFNTADFIRWAKDLDLQSLGRLGSPGLSTYFKIFVDFEKFENTVQKIQTHLKLLNVVIYSR